MWQIAVMKNIKSIGQIEIFIWCMARLNALHDHLVRYRVAYILMLVGLWAFAARYAFSFNVSNSLNGTLYLLEKNKLPSRNDYAAFKYPSDFIYPRNSHFLKRAVGVAGDTVESKNNQFFVNGQPVGRAMPVTSQGIPIEESQFKGIIPAGYYYMMGDHPKSLDSRYKVVGLISSQMIIGRGFLLF